MQVKVFLKNEQVYLCEMKWGNQVRAYMLRPSETLLLYAFKTNFSSSPINSVARKVKTDKSGFFILKIKQQFFLRKCAMIKNIFKKM